MPGGHAGDRDRWVSGTARLIGGGGGALVGGFLAAAHETTMQTSCLLCGPLILATLVILPAIRLQAPAKARRCMAADRSILKRRWPPGLEPTKFSGVAMQDPAELHL